MLKGYMYICKLIFKRPEKGYSKLWFAERVFLFFVFLCYPAGRRSNRTDSLSPLRLLHILLASLILPPFGCICKALK